MALVNFTFEGKERKFNSLDKYMCKSEIPNDMEVTTVGQIQSPTLFFKLCVEIFSQIILSPYLHFNVRDVSRILHCARLQDFSSS